MNNVFLEVINSVNLVNKKMNDNMKSLFSKYIKLLAVLLLSIVGVTQAWAADATFTMANNVFDGTNQNATVTSPVNATITTTTTKSNAKTGKLGSDGNYFEGSAIPGNGTILEDKWTGDVYNLTLLCLSIPWNYQIQKNLSLLDLSTI